MRQCELAQHRFVNAILYVTENGCKWRTFPKSYGNRHIFYVRMSRWRKSGVLNAFSKHRKYQEPHKKADCHIRKKRKARGRH